MATDHPRQEGEPGTGKSEKPVASPIDFHSPEFNTTDDLNDYSGNYLFFQTLDGIVTADMRHQMDRRKRRDLRNLSGEDAGCVKDGEGQREGESEQVNEEISPLMVSSQGRTLIVDTDAERAVACGTRLNEQGLSCTVLVVKDSATEDFSPRWEGLAQRKVNSVSISGAFGGFSAMITVKGTEEKLSKWPDKRPAVFDLVLDFQSIPSYAGTVLPLGYFAPGLAPEPAKIADVLEELPEMKGCFEKPRFTVFLKNRCLLGRSRISSCRRCLDICPVKAITPGNQEISIDSYICQGCGGCALVCPADAIHMAAPSLGKLLDTLRSRLETERSESGSFPTLVVTDSETIDDMPLQRGDEKKNGVCVYCDVESMGRVGLEMLLASLAWGAGRIVVACGPRTSPGIQKAVQEQVQMAEAVLAALSMPGDAIRLVSVSEQGSDWGKTFSSADLGKKSDRFSLCPDGNLPGEEKRAVTMWAAQYLNDQQGCGRRSITLPPGAPFGAVTVDTGTCTLCMACAVACPTHALSAAGDVPRLDFLEFRCHQCGLCREVCSEGSIQLLPRLLCDPKEGDAPVALHEVEPFRCVECGVPFATRAMIDRLRDKLSGHWMYTNERQLRRLQMCRTCRTRDALTSQDMKSWNR